MPIQERLFLNRAYGMISRRENRSVKHYKGILYVEVCTENHTQRPKAAHIRSLVITRGRRNRSVKPYKEIL